MLRFILKNKRYDGFEFRHENLFTVDADCPVVEAELRKGGYGGGPNGDAFDVTELIGIQVLGGEK